MSRLESAAKKSAGNKSRRRIGSRPKAKARAYAFAEENATAPYTPRTRAGARTAKAPAAGHISIRDLQKLSAESILALAGPTTVKSGDRAVALLVPLKPPDPKRLSEALKLAAELAKQRDPAEDEAFLISIGADPTNWTEEAVRKVQEEWRAMK